MRIAALAMLAAGVWTPQYGPADGRDLSPTDLDRIRVGQSAPDFMLPGADGRATRLADFRGKNVVLVFYRGHW